MSRAAVAIAVADGGGDGRYRCADQQNVQFRHRECASSTYNL
jgi:hypothetical protein